MDWNLAVRAAELALASYSAVTIETDKVHAFIQEDDTTVSLGLQGTHDFKALLLDAAAMVHRNDPILGHTPDPFASDAEQIFWRVLPNLPPNKALLMGAHSKGASELQALTVMFRRAGRVPIFAGYFEPAPMGALNNELLGQEGVATWLGLDIARIDERDPVPGAMPPWAPLPHAFPVTPLAWAGARPFDILDYHSMAAVLAAVKAAASSAGKSP